MNNYSMGFITNNERYNQVIDVWTTTNARLTVMKNISSDKQGFNSVYMMLDSGSKRVKEQIGIRQLSGMRGLMAKPKKSGDHGESVPKNPITTNFKRRFINS